MTRSLPPIVAGMLLVHRLLAEHLLQDTRGLQASEHDVMHLIRLRDRHCQLLSAVLPDNGSTQKSATLTSQEFNLLEFWVLTLEY